MAELKDKQGMEQCEWLINDLLLRISGLELKEAVAGGPPPPLEAFSAPPACGALHWLCWWMKVSRPETTRFTELREPVTVSQFGQGPSGDGSRVARKSRWGLSSPSFPGSTVGRGKC